MLVGTAEGKDGQSAIYTTAYQYYVSGLRAQTTYTTPNGTTQWVYGDYVRCGNPLQGALAFQTMVQLDSYGDPTTNEFHYAYDQSGRLVEAAFAQTPTAGSASNGSWYSANDPAESRAHVVYDYDAGGRCAGVYDYWDTYCRLPMDYDHATS
ncbi:MAG: hypothetical protein M9921_11610 [Fimbriimonadaceae bacterium]|nr:hypothetical protein [Fimbriimonadaceae bacterium]